VKENIKINIDNLIKRITRKINTEKDLDNYLHILNELKKNIYNTDFEKEEFYNKSISIIKSLFIENLFNKTISEDIFEETLTLLKKILTEDLIKTSKREYDFKNEIEVFFNKNRLSLNDFFVKYFKLMKLKKYFIRNYYYEKRYKDYLKEIIILAEDKIIPLLLRKIVENDKNFENNLESIINEIRKHIIDINSLSKEFVFLHILQQFLGVLHLYQLT
jgi:hypothetical protein